VFVGAVTELAVFVAAPADGRVVCRRNREQRGPGGRFARGVREHGAILIAVFRRVRASDRERVFRRSRDRAPRAAFVR